MSDVVYRNDAIEAIDGIVSTLSVCINVDECKGMFRMKKRAKEEVESLSSAVSPHNDDYTEFIEDLLAYEERNDMFNLTTKERAEFQSYVRERMEL
jgi:hypothetical protein